MKVTKNTGAIGGLLAALSCILFLVPIIILAEPLQSVYANHKDLAPLSFLVLLTIPWGVMFAFVSNLSIAMIKARAFTETNIDVSGWFTSPKFIGWSAISIVVFMAELFVWYSQL